MVTAQNHHQQRKSLEFYDGFFSAMQEVCKKKHKKMLILLK